MGYKRAGFKVLGNVEIDPRIERIYRANHHPEHSYNMDIREFNKLEDLPSELYDLDVLDGSPPCTVFSMAGLREETWGKAKTFREGQAKQTLDDLFMVFLDTVEKLRPKAVVAENVEGMLRGNAKGYVSEIISRFKELGYAVQLFKLNARDFDVPQERERVFFIANRMGWPKLTIDKSNTKPITFGQIREGEGIPLKKGSVMYDLMQKARKGDRDLGEVSQRTTGKIKCFSTKILYDERVPNTLPSSGQFIRYADKTLINDRDCIHISSFPEDYDFGDQSVQYVCGMSVPPSQMAHIAHAIKSQWLEVIP